jgi:hypothetical protein
MARIKYGSLVSDISGSIGSATFQKNLYGNTLRQRPHGYVSSTARQLLCQSLMAQCHNAWSALTDQDRIQWNQFIAFSGASINRDKSILLSGHSLFLKYNFQRLLSRKSLYTSIRYLSAPQWPGILNCYLIDDEIIVNLDNSPPISNFWVTMFFSIPRPASQSFNPVGLCFVKAVQINTEAINFSTNYQSVFGFIPTIGSILHYKIQFWSTLSPILSSIQKGKFFVEDF